MTTEIELVHFAANDWEFGRTKLTPAAHPPFGPCQGFHLRLGDLRF